MCVKCVCEIERKKVISNTDNRSASTGKTKQQRERETQLIEIRRRTIKAMQVPWKFFFKNE